jgi:hypothetical protein
MRYNQQLEQTKPIVMVFATVLNDEGFKSSDFEQK